jgi:hypothetical protein
MNRQVKSIQAAIKSILLKQEKLESIIGLVLFNLDFFSWVAKN